jgi:hemoglobin
MPSCWLRSRAPPVVRSGGAAFCGSALNELSARLVLRWCATFCDHANMHTVFEATGGISGLRRLAEAWHHRVMADDVVSHAFSHGFHPQHVERLAAYWAEALGGPSTYSDTYGDETTVVKMHSGNGKHDEMDRRAIACFDEALVDAGLADDAALRQVLHDYFAWATTTTMARYHQSADDVPSGLSIPRWSWDGLQE